MKLDGLVAVITGGASGLGEATARRLLASGARGIAVLDANGERGAALAREFAGRFLFARTDVGVEAEVNAAMAAAMDHFSSIHVLVNAAAIGGPARLLSRNGVMPMALFEQVIRVNLYGVMHTMRSALPEMLKNDPNADGERGVVINVSSGAAWEGQIGQVGYSASKAGLLGLTMPLMREFAEHGVRITAIAPGLFDTPIYDGVPAALKQRLVEQTLFPKRMGKPDEFAMFVEEVIRNPMHNGRNYRLDAGMILRPSA